MDPGGERGLSRSREGRQEGWGGVGVGVRQHLPQALGLYGPGSLVTPAVLQGPQVLSVLVALALPRDTSGGLRSPPGPMPLPIHCQPSSPLTCCVALGPRPQGAVARAQRWPQARPGGQGVTASTEQAAPPGPPRSKDRVKARPGLPTAPRTLGRLLKRGRSSTGQSHRNRKASLKR